MRIPNIFMVVDDDRTTTMLCNHALSRFAKESLIKLYTNPETALKAIEEEYNKKDVTLSTVLFLDINMPHMNGWEFLEVFKNFNEDIQKHFAIYMLSSSIDIRDKEKAEGNPLVSGFISKPLTTDVLNKVFYPVKHKL